MLPVFLLVSSLICNAQTMDTCESGEWSDMKEDADRCRAMKENFQEMLAKLEKLRDCRRCEVDYELVTSYCYVTYKEQRLRRACANIKDYSSDTRIENMRVCCRRHFIFKECIETEVLSAPDAQKVLDEVVEISEALSAINYRASYDT